MTAFLCFSWRVIAARKHTTVVRAALMCFSA
jgi:hypothetical protein